VERKLIEQKPKIRHRSKGRLDLRMYTEVQADSENVSLGIVLVSIAAVFGCSLVMIVTNSSLVGDGSYYVLRAIQTGQPCACAAGRQGINLVREGPLLLAVHQGITNTHVLTVLEGVGFLLFPALVWILAIVHARGSRVRFTLVTMSCSLCFATMIFFSVSELTLALPLVVLVSVLLTQPTPWSGPKAALAIVATLFLCFSHESLVPCAVILGVTAVVRIRARLGTNDTRASIAVLVLSVAVLGSAICTLVLWPNPNSNTFLELPASAVFLYLGAFCLIGWAVLYGRPFGLSWLRWVLLVLAGASTLNGIRLAITGGPLAAYFTRGVAVTLVAALQLLLLVDWTIRLRGMDPRIWTIRLSSGAARGAAAFLVALMIVPTVSALRWSTVIGDFRQTVTQHKGVVPATEVPSSPGTSYLWSWTNPTLSLLLRSSSSNAVVENTTTDVVPFSVDSTEHQIPPAYGWSS
jgi:hypothetical protein